MDAVSMEAKETILPGDLNRDLLSQKVPWINMINMNHLRQVITRPTRIPVSSESLINPIDMFQRWTMLLKYCVPASACGDHYPVCLTWSRKGAKIPTAGHKTTTYRSFANFDENSSVRDLIASPLSVVYNLSDTNDAMEFWIKAFSDFYSKCAPFKARSSKPRELNRWRNPNGYQRNCKKQSISVICWENNKQTNNKAATRNQKS